MSEPYVQVVSREDIARRAGQLGEELSADYAGRVPVFIGVLNGCLPFLADLVRGLSIDCEMDFLSLTRFGEDGRVGIALDLSLSIEDRDVIIVEDIVDTGLTLTSLRRIIELHEVSTLRTVALLDKSARRIVDVPVEYRGFEVGDEFLLGYGLDWEGRYRNVPSLWAVMDMARLAEEPESFGEVAFPDASRRNSRFAAERRRGQSMRR